MQPPGNVVTLHRDTFFKFKKLYPDDKRTKVRLNLYLEDWKIGHMIQYQDIHNKKEVDHFCRLESWRWFTMG